MNQEPPASIPIPTSRIPVPNIRTPDQRLRVFVSSTLDELRPERRAAREAIAALRLTPVFFEAGARPYPPRELYRAYLSQSDIFIGIYWQRYGWVAPETEISGLEEEYRLSEGKTRLIYIKRPAPEREPQLQQLLDRIRNENFTTYQKFSTPTELHDLLANDLAQLLTDRYTRPSQPLNSPSAIRWRAATGATILAIALAAGGWMLRSHKAQLLTDKDTIILADFTNTTGDPVFDGTLRQGLSVQLEQSPFLSIISDQRIQQTLQMMDQKPDAKLTPQIARELCQRTGSATVLDGSIAQIGTRYLVTVKAVNCVTEESVASAEVQASDKNQVLDALGKTASEIRTKLGESLTTVQKFDTPLEQATTPSLEALKAYSLGIKTWEEKGDSEAVPFFKRAIELDPNFAMAYVALGMNYYNLTQTSLANENMNKAFELRDRVSERERDRITAEFYAVGPGDAEQAIQAYKLWAQSFPRDDLAHIELGDEYMLLGRWELALSETQESLRLNQVDVVAYGNLGQIYLALNRVEDARAALRQGSVRKLDGWDLRLMMYYLAFLRGDAEEMKQQVEWNAGRPGSEDIFLSAQADTEAYYGHMREAQELSRRAVESALRAGAKETAATWQVDAALRNAEIGDGEQARQEIASVLSMSSGTDERKLAALALARVGDAAHSEAAVEGLAKSNPSNTLLNYYWLPTIRAAAELDHKNPVKAIELLQPASAYELGRSEPFQFGTLYSVYIRGEAYLALHQGSQAAAEYQKILDHRGIVLNFPIGALAHLGLARAYVLQGDTGKACAAYQDFLTLWKGADPDVPILKQAKAEYAKLQ
jgi:eukaryotic-like serine/threonine-protein kinase